MQTCPLLRHLPQAMRRVASARCAVASITAGLFPPSSNVTEAKLSAAAFMTFFPMLVPPVKQMCWKGRNVRKALTSGPPWTTATCSSGRARDTMAARTLDVSGVCSEGLTITRFPAARALTNGRRVKMTGKFQGEMMSMCPLGFACTKDLVPSIASPVSTGRGAIQPRKCRRAI